MNKRKKSDVVTKAFKLKAKIGSADIMKDWKPAIEEYNNYYNRLSDWIRSNLTTSTVGYVTRLVDPSKEYRKYFVDNGKEGQPFYTLFTDPYAQAVNNLLFEAVRNLNPEGYTGRNVFGFCESAYRRDGYVAEVIANYRTKMSSIDPKVKSHSLGDDPKESLLLEQTAYEVIKNGIKEEKDWLDALEYQNLKAEKNLRLIRRLETLSAFWKANKDDVDTYIGELRAKNLSGFEGCKRSGKLSMRVRQQNFKIEPEKKSDYKLTVPIRGHKIVLSLLGTRALVRVGKGGVRKDLADLTKKGDHIIFQIAEGKSGDQELYAIITLDTQYTKTAKEPDKVVGVDVNIKHTLLATSIASNRMKGYVNLYGEFLKNKDFKEGCGADLHLYKEIAKHPTFGILEVESLFARTLHQLNRTDGTEFGKVSSRNAYKRELAMKEVFKSLEEKHKDDHKVLFYLGSVQKLRAQYKAYYILKETYFEKQSEYDKAAADAGVTDQTPFAETKKGRELLCKLDRVGRTIIGCRDNIVTYAFDVIRKNGYDTIALEYLTSSQFKKRGRRSFPSVQSLLKFHKLEGKDKSVWEGEWKDLHKYYDPVYDGSGLITDFTLTSHGIEVLKKDNFYNLIIKAVHFADVKDKFAQLSNNNEMQTAFVPSAFTSQMDSLTHKIYFVKEVGKDGKELLKLINKKYVRRRQETHVNGLNADYNAACTICYFAENGDLRKLFTIQGTNFRCYNNPEFLIKEAYKKGVGEKVIKTLKSTGHIHVLSDKEYEDMKSKCTGREE